MRKMEKGKSGSTSASSTRAPKIERKIVEKERRSRMKILCSHLLSLLPDHDSKQGMPLPEQMDAVVAYIKNLKTKVEKMKEKKESLLPIKRSHSSITTTEIQVKPKTMAPLVEVQDMGPYMDVILVTGLDDLSKFYSILRFLHGDGIEVAHANFSIHGHSTIQILYNKVGNANAIMGFGDSTTMLSRKLKSFICGTTCSEVEPNTDLLWDSEIQSDSGVFGVQQFLESDLGVFGIQEFLGACTSLECCQGMMHHQLYYK